jgi:cytochrome c
MRSSGLLLGGAVGLLGAMGTAVAANEATPPAQFAICSACHTTTTDGANSMGPNLRGVVGRKAGTAPGFQYSAAMKKSGIRWTPQELNAFLADVPAKVPGTLMPFPGLPDAQDRQAVIAYLQSLKKL